MEQVLIGTTEAMAGGRRPVVRILVALAAVVGALVVACATAVVWLCFTQPATVVSLVGEGQVGAILAAVADVLVSTLERAVRYL